MILGLVDYEGKLYLMSCWWSHWANCDRLNVISVPDKNRDCVCLTALVRNHVYISTQRDQLVAGFCSSEDCVWASSDN